MSEAPADDPPAVKDPDAAHPIAGAWRAMLRDVVRCFARGDYRLEQGVPGVDAVSAATAEQVRAYLADFGGTLVELPDETWQTSVAQWMGTHWEVLVDLQTAEEGRSDLALAGEIRETSAGPRLRISMVYVP